MDRNRKRDGLWREQGGACFYCDGPTFVLDIEPRDVARRRLHIEVGVVGAGKQLISTRLRSTALPRRWLASSATATAQPKLRPSIER